MNYFTFLILFACSLCWTNAASISKNEDHVSNNSDGGTESVDNKTDEESREEDNEHEDDDDDDDEDDDEDDNDKDNDKDKYNNNKTKKRIPFPEIVMKRGPVSGVQSDRRPFMMKVLRQPIPMSQRLFRMFGPNRRKAWFARYG